MWSSLRIPCILLLRSPLPTHPTLPPLISQVNLLAAILAASDADLAEEDEAEDKDDVARLHPKTTKWVRCAVGSGVCCVGSRPCV